VVAGRISCRLGRRENKPGKLSAIGEKNKKQAVGHIASYRIRRPKW
jgi:hypothetical protein